MISFRAAGRHARAARLYIAFAGTLVLMTAPAAHAAKQPGTSGAKTDRSNPTIAITAPTAGTTVGGQVSVTGTAADNVAVGRVEISVDGGSWQLASGTQSWTAQISTSAYADGTHSVAARATDTAGRQATSSVTFVTSNEAAADTQPPTVQIAAPLDGATVARQLVVSGSAGDDTGVAKVELRLDDGPFQTASGGASWSTTLDATAAADGDHVLTARATDAAGNASSASVSVRMSDDVVPAPAMSPGTIGGFIFQETDRDGVFETGEQPLAGTYVYLYTSLGTYVGNAATDAGGWYRFTGLASGTYRAEIAPMSWNALKSDWVPDTTGSIFPRLTVNLASSARADFGTRRIVRSTDASAPISTYVGPNGLTVKSYDDVVPAREVYDRLASGTLVGAEASYVTIRFDFAQAGLTSTLAMKSNGVYVDYRAVSDVTWSGWLRADGELFHEYGHAWSKYYATMVQADPTLRAYLEARGLYGDSRVGSSYAWDPDEMIAEDYRQLFGTASAQGDTQVNRSIPLAKDVPGLKSFLSGTFMQTRVY